MKQISLVLILASLMGMFVVNGASAMPTKCQRNLTEVLSNAENEKKSVKEVYSLKEKLDRKVCSQTMPKEKKNHKKLSLSSLKTISTLSLIFSGVSFVPLAFAALPLFMSLATITPLFFVLLGLGVLLALVGMALGCIGLFNTSREYEYKKINRRLIVSLILSILSVGLAVFIFLGLSLVTILNHMISAMW